MDHHLRRQRVAQAHFAGRYQSLRSLHQQRRSSSQRTEYREHPELQHESAAIASPLCLNSAMLPTRTTTPLEASLTRQPTKTGALGDTYFTLGYTYGHSIDNASGFRQRNSGTPYYNTSAFRASSDLDVRHRITLSGGWDLALDHWWEIGWKKVTQGWSVFPIFTWHTGFPIDVPARFGDRFDPTAPGPSGAGDPISLMLTSSVLPAIPRPSQAAASDSGYGTGTYWINPNSFSNSLRICGSHVGGCPNGYGSPYGNLGRNHLRGPQLHESRPRSSQDHETHRAGQHAIARRRCSTC